MSEQRVDFTNTRGQKLIGDLSIVSQHKAVILSHGFMSDRNGSGRLPALASALNDAGISTLRYDFAGCGESDDEILTPGGLRDDLRSAIRYMQSQDFTSIGLYGHSLGGTISIYSFVPEVKALATTGAVTGPCFYRFEDFFPEAALNKLKRTGILQAPARSGPRPLILASQELMDAFNNFSPDELLGPLTIPILLINGGADEEERMLAQIAAKHFPRLPEGSKLNIYEDAPHDMHAIWPRVTKQLVEWFADRL